MSNRRRHRTEHLPDRFSWLLCRDCASTLHEVIRGNPPKVSLTIELEHSPTCPDWRGNDRELLVAFVPPGEAGETQP